MNTVHKNGEYSQERWIFTRTVNIHKNGEYAQERWIFTKMVNIHKNGEYSHSCYLHSPWTCFSFISLRFIDNNTLFYVKGAINNNNSKVHLYLNSAIFQSLSLTKDNVNDKDYINDVIFDKRQRHRQRLSTTKITSLSLTKDTLCMCICIFIC